MSSEKETNFNIKVPQLKKKNQVGALRTSVKKQYNEVYKNLDVKITDNNRREIEDLILATQDLLDNCINDSGYSGKKDETFINLIYICHKLDLKFESYKLTEKMRELELKSEEITKRQNDAEEKSNNLVYNLLGFLTAFSLVSGVVGVVSNIQGVVQIMIFMVFTTIILLTTLIGLHNFYENNNNRKNKLQDNYFLWKIAVFVLIGLVITLCAKTILDNKENIFNYIDSKIEKVIEEKVNNKLEEN